MNATVQPEPRYQIPRPTTWAITEDSADRLQSTGQMCFSLGRVHHGHAPVSLITHPASGAHYAAVFTVFERDEDLLEVARTFAEHKLRWMQDTAYTSSLTEMTSHPSYLRIIGLGKPALPLIFQSLRDEPAHWFVALMSITGEDPLGGRYDMTFDEMMAVWLRWGSEHEYM